MKESTMSIRGAELVVRVEEDSLGPVNVPGDKFWGAQTQRSLEHFSIGDDLIPREMIPAYAIVKKAAALVNHKAGRLADTQKNLIVRVCDEVLAGQHQDQFPLHVWMTGSGTQGSATSFRAFPHGGNLAHQLSPTSYLVEGTMQQVKHESRRRPPWPVVLVRPGVL